MPCVDMYTNVYCSNLLVRFCFWRIKPADTFFCLYVAHSVQNEFITSESGKVLNRLRRLPFIAFEGDQLRRFLNTLLTTQTENAPFEVISTQMGSGIEER